MHHRLHQQALGEGIDKRARHEPAAVEERALAQVFGVREQNFDHARDADEGGDVGIEDRPADRLEAESDRRVFPRQPKTDGRDCGAGVHLSSAMVCSGHLAFSLCVPVQNRQCDFNDRICD
jgi:hypothetical protein